MKVTMTKILPHKKELIFLVVLLVVLLAFLLIPRNTGASVQVTIDGRDAGTYSLLQNRTVPIEGYGGYTLELVIEDGKAHVEHAACPDLICQNHAAISKSGQQIICLPARTVISVSEDSIEEEALPDAVVG